MKSGTEDAASAGRTDGGAVPAAEPMGVAAATLIGGTPRRAAAAALARRCAAATRRQSISADLS
jgi:hypothetical protein